MIELTETLTRKGWEGHATEAEAVKTLLKRAVGGDRRGEGRRVYRNLGIVEFMRWLVSGGGDPTADITTPASRHRREIEQRRDTETIEAKIKRIGRERAGDTP